MPSILEHVQAIQQGRQPPPPIAALIGFKITEAEAGRVAMELPAGPQHANPMGSLHGGVLCDLGDAAMGTAFATTCEDGETYATIELKCNFLRPVWTALLTARAWLVYRGKTVGMAECEVRDERDRLIAKLSSTLTVLRGDAARGRPLQ